MLFKVPVEVSARHVHLSSKDLVKLFGTNYKLKFKKELSQPGQFLCEEKLDIFCGDYYINNVSVLGPLRKESQIEISLTDARNLKINVPIRESGDLDNSASCRLVSGYGSVDLPYGLICSKRHIHMNFEDKLKFGNISNGDICSLKIDTSQRPIVFNNVVIRIDKNFKLVAHIDTDEANAAGINEKINGIINFLK